MKDTKGGKEREKRSHGKRIAKQIGSGSREMVPMSELFGKVIPDKRAKINDKWLDDYEEDDECNGRCHDCDRDGLPCEKRNGQWAHCDCACNACENPCELNGEE